VAMDVDLEVGGNDQMFNMLAGRTLQKVINNKEKFVLTLKLLADDSGKKMGKSEGNAVFMNQSPTDMFGKVMSWADGVIGIAFELCTRIPFYEVKAIYENLKDPENNPRDAKVRLAYEIVKINHSEEAAAEAKEYFERVFSKKEVPEEIEEMEVKNGAALMDILVENGLAESKADARRKIEQGGVKFDDIAENDWKIVIGEGFSGKIMKVGKREFRKIKIS